MYPAKIIGIFAIGLIFASRGLSAQSSLATKEPNVEIKLPVYDVVSIKPNKSGGNSVDTRTNRDRYLGTNVSIAELIEEAYGIKKPLISGLAGPLASAHFDIEAKILDPDPVTMKGLTDPQRNSMLRPILAEYFRLVGHTEIKMLPVYDLVLSKGGSKLKPSPSDNKPGEGIRVHNTELEAHNVSMVYFARHLTDLVQRTVIDKTGLDGIYDLTMKWSPDGVQQEDNGSAETQAPSIFTAIQEQLGLKLQSSKGPVVTFVVDHVELPLEN